MEEFLKRNNVDFSGYDFFFSEIHLNENDSYFYMKINIWSFILQGTTVTCNANMTLISWVTKTKTENPFGDWFLSFQLSLT